MDADIFESQSHGLLGELVSASDARRYAAYAALNRQQPDYYNDASGVLSRYADVLGESLLRNFQARLEAATGLELFPCYSLLRVYPGNSAFSGFENDPQSEIVALLNLGGSADNAWPLAVQATGKDYSYELPVGGALVLRRAQTTVSHERLGANQQVELAMHFVTRNGDLAHHRFDGRRGLGEPQNRLEQDKFIAQRPEFDAALASGDDRRCFCRSGSQYSLCHGRQQQTLPA